MGESTPRTLDAVVADRLERSPVVALVGARQVGKSTLALAASAGGRRSYLTLDDMDVLDRARRDPRTLAESSEFLTIDEVQRAPELLLALKAAVDRDRRPGRFLVTGSANLLLMKNVGDSLAGRAVYVVMRPMSEREKRGRSTVPPWTRWLESPGADPSIAAGNSGETFDWRRAAIEGGFPPAALAASDRDRDVWFDGYVDTYVHRDVRDLAQIGDIPAFVRLFRLLALRNGAMLNQAELALTTQIPRATAQRWIGVLATSFLVQLLPPFVETRAKRIVKTPKCYVVDSGLGLFLAGIRDLQPAAAERSAGAWLESIVLNDLAVWRETTTPKAEIYYWRTSDGIEVDFVIEYGRRLLPIEVKATKTPLLADARGIVSFCRLHADRAPFGILLYGGDRTIMLTPQCLAIPIADAILGGV